MTGFNMPAFPVNENAGMQGMSLRDYFAAKAMQGFCADHSRDQVENMRTLAVYAYEMADAMLKARKQ